MTRERCKWYVTVDSTNTDSCAKIVLLLWTAVEVGALLYFGVKARGCFLDHRDIKQLCYARVILPEHSVLSALRVLH